MADSAYSFSLTTFNPSGKLLQIEYALNAVNNNGRTSLGIRCKNGVVIATEKKLPTILVDEESHKKIGLISTSGGVVYSGLGPDYRVLVRKARKKAQAYYMKYKVYKVKSLI
jgi:20S proteasome subunit alpha 2